jgi:hypothetical protein
MRIEDRQEEHCMRFATGGSGREDRCGRRVGAVGGFAAGGPNQEDCSRRIKAGGYARGWGKEGRGMRIEVGG